MHTGVGGQKLAICCIETKEQNIKCMRRVRDVMHLIKHVTILVEHGLHARRRAARHCSRGARERSERGA
jgi:hypothetical protein